jgi:hypothetical protein
MKVVDLKEAKANLEQFARECQSSPVVVTDQGQPLFEMVPIRSDDPDFMDRLLESDPAFRELLEDRHREKTAGKVSSIEEARRRLVDPTA